MTAGGLCASTQRLTCSLLRRQVSATGRGGKRSRSDEDREDAQQQAEGEAEGEAGDEPTSSTSLPQSSLPGHSLVDLIGLGMDLKETEHMQPAVMKLMHASASCLGCRLHIEDTHSKSSQMFFPNNQPDVTALAEPGSRSWGNAVYTGEFKLESTPPQISTAIGQEIKRTRYIFDSQAEERRFAVALILTLNSLELLWIKKGEEGGMIVYSTGKQPFSVSPASPGFQWLVRLLLTPQHELGFVKAAVPELQQLEGVAFGRLELIRRGTAHGSGSFVWACSTAEGRVILKLNKNPLEACHVHLQMHVLCMLPRVICPCWQLYVACIALARQYC